jgi:hypothetical protein
MCLSINLSFFMLIEVKAQVIFAADSQQFLFGYIASYSNCLMDKIELCELQLFISSFLSILFYQFFLSCIRLINL